ncbi:MAG: hypothetical protein B7O98_03925 [Zestosphaera tikiterensis]|uniref:ABC transporter domain-containing protein n=1 Tax=Zestosphaera tikiterensis TaxID=1973259 RepID=A0A2R7Y7R5_9CREN|nr:MAG: hypothetical protein B7O98_03925 [Zestosphaera tikiterensis]
MTFELNGFTVRLDGALIVNEVDLSLSRGEAVLIAGPSGAGKSTLLKSLCGVIPKVVRGSVSGFVKPSLDFLHRSSIYLHQEPWFFITTPYVWSEVLSFTDFKRLSDVQEVLNHFKLSRHLMRSTYTLSAGEVQRLAFIIATHSSKDLILLDEPTAYLDRPNADNLIKYVKELKGFGKSFIIVDHDVSVWLDVVDKVYYMVDGKLVEDEPEYYSKAYEALNDLDPSESRDCLKHFIFEVDEIKFPDAEEPLLKDFKLEVCSGEVVLIKGYSGVGKTTLLKTLAEKSVKDGRIKSVLIPDNPLLYFSGSTPAEELNLANPQLSSKFLQDFGLSSKSNIPVVKLSTGERRRLALASALARGYELVFMDEPTIGLDPWNKYLVLKGIKKVAELGTGFVIASHDEDLLKIANEVINLEDWR